MKRVPRIFQHPTKMIPQKKFRMETEQKEAKKRNFLSCRQWIALDIKIKFLNNS